MENPYTVIGTRQARLDGMDKACGEAKYAADLQMPRMLHGKLLRSPFPHARVLRVHAERALSMAGVRVVVTGADVPGQKYGSFPSRRDQTGLARDKVRYIGDPVAAVAAVDEETALAALERIEVEYEELPAVFDSEMALAAGAPLIHEEYPGNVCAYRRLDFGDIQKGFGESFHVREDHFFSQAVSHGVLEPRAVLASFDRSGRLTVWTSTQSPYWVRRDLSLVLNLPTGRIRVIKPCVGGGFGGKGDLLDHEVAAALMSMKSGRPVRIVLSREEEISCTRIRNEMSIDVKTGVMKDGAIAAQYVRCVANGGAYASTSVMLIYNSAQTCLIPYRIPHFRYDGTMAYTNRAASGAMRGHGANQPRFAVECQLDRIAEDIGMDPAELRLRNATQRGDTSVNGLVFDSCELSRAIREATRSAGWKEKKRRKERHRGIGIACGGFVCGARSGGHTASGSFVQVHEDGGVTLLTGSSDIGQGSETTLAQFVAEELGLSPLQVTVISADTEETPIDPGTFSSRVTFYAGNATLLAAREVKGVLAEVAGRQLGVSKEEIEFKDGSVRVRSNPDKALPFSRLSRIAVSEGSGRLIIGKGQWSPTNTQFPDPKTQYGNVSGAYSFSAQVAEVEVDPETGEVRLLHVTIGDDCGRVINILGAEGQAEGSVSMGQGQALLENILFGDRGQMMNPSLLEYKIPTALEMADVSLLECGSPDPLGPYGAKEIGEGLIISTVPAILNAIYDAVGVRITSLPVDPEKILQAMGKESPSR